MVVSIRETNFHLGAIKLCEICKDLQSSETLFLIAKHFPLLLLQYGVTMARSQNVVIARQNITDKICHKVHCK